MLDRAPTNSRIAAEPASAQVSPATETDEAEFVDRREPEALRTRPLIRSPWIYFLVVTLFDSFLGAFSVHTAVRVRHDFLNTPILDNVEEVAAWAAFFICAAVWTALRVPRAIWRFTSVDDIGKLGGAVIISMLTLPLFMYLFVNAGAGFPRSTPIIAGPLFFILLVVSRLLVVVLRNGDIRALAAKSRKGRDNVILVGSSTALSDSVRDMGRGGSFAGDLNAIGLITTDTTQIGRSIRGIPVIGTPRRLKTLVPGLAKKYGEPPRLIAVDPNPRREDASALVRIAAEVGAPLSRFTPSTTGGLATGLTPFEAQDLIGRRPKSLDIEPVRRLIEGQRILITGAGGSIGSELVRQVAALDPSDLVLVDHSEFNLYRIDRELQDTAPEGLRWHPLLGDVTDTKRMEEIVSRHLPDLVLHAAALKHVPLGEANPLQTLHTNVEGTRVLLDLCVGHNIPSFTLVSTDKAVNVSNVMGASKAIAEMLTHAYNQSHPGLSACAVRFGNVLASAGSVIPRFEAQIARGGPVTVTHPDVTRYFMTTEEASALVLQATALNSTQRKSESSIYVLEMGEPVNIARLARQLIRLRGKVPDRDVPIVFTGLRPGETLDERVVADPEEVETTYVDGLLHITGSTYDADAVPARVTRLIEAVRTRDLPGVRRMLTSLLPSYRPNGNLTDHASPES